MTLTGACALVVRGGDGGKDSTGSDGGVALLAIPRSPLLRVRHDLDESACNQWCWRLPQRQLQPLDTEMWSPDIVDVAAADDDVAAVVVVAAEIVAFCYFLAGSMRSLVDP